MAVPDAIRQVGERLIQLVQDEAVRCGLSPEVALRRPDAAFFADPSPGVALHLYSVEPRPSPDSTEELEDAQIDGEPWTVFRPAPLPTDLRWAIAARAADAAAESTLLEVVLRAIHAPARTAAPHCPPSQSPLSPPAPSPRAFDGQELLLVLDDTFDLERQALLLRSLGAPHHPLIGCMTRIRLRSNRELRRVRRVDKRTVITRPGVERLTESTRRQLVANGHIGGLLGRSGDTR